MSRDPDPSATSNPPPRTPGRRGKARKPDRIDSGTGERLTRKQELFVAEYLIDLNATQAAIRAGYSKKTAASQGERLLRNVEVSRGIASGMDARAKATGITKERVVRELELIAFSDVTHYSVDELGQVTLAEGAPSGAYRAVSSIKHRLIPQKDDAPIREVEIKLWDKVSPLRLAGRHVDVKGFFDKMEVTGKDGKDLVPATKGDALAALAALGIKEAGKTE